MNQFLKYFFRGILFITPLAVTSLLIISVVNWVIKKLELTNLTGIYLVGFLVLGVILVSLIGYLGSNLILKPISSAIDRIITKIPVVSIIYTSLKDLTTAFVGERKKFNKPVLVLVDKQNQLYKPGFITQKDLEFIQQPGKVAVYLPHSYAISGTVIIVERESVVPVEYSSTDFMKFIVSGGVAISHDKTKKDLPM